MERKITGIKQCFLNKEGKKIYKLHNFEENFINISY